MTAPTVTKAAATADTDRVRRIMFPSDAERVKDIIDEATLLERLPVSPRTLRNWRDKGLLPFIRLPNTRRLLYSWGAVHAAILRRQQGGVV